MSASLIRFWMGSLTFDIICHLLFQFEGTPLYPDAGRMWAVCEKYKVSKFYTAPTAIRMLMKFGTEIVKKYWPFVLFISHKRFELLDRHI